MEKTKAAHHNQIFWGIKVYLARDIELLVLLYDIALFLLISIVYFFWGKNIFRGYSQLDYHLIHLTDIRKPYLISFQVCNVLNIL